MRISIVFSIIAIAAGPAHADEVPFFTTADVPDYTARMIEHETYGVKGGRLKFVQHHNGWTRVEEERDDETHVYYGQFFKNVVLNVSGKNGEITSFAISRVEPSRDYFGITEVKETNDVEMVGGERCRWRELVRKMNNDSSGPHWLSCLTDDGIEVATKVLFSDGKIMSETRLIELQRRPVPEAAVRPPMQLFDAGTWLKPLPGYDDYTPNPGDFEAKLINGRSEERLLRHYPWWLEQRDGEDGSIWITVWNELEDQGLRYSVSMGKRRFEAIRSPLDPGPLSKRFDDMYGMVDMGEQDRLLGEDCAWFNRTPDTADAGQWQCLTSDGIPLIDVHLPGGVGGGKFKIVALTRRPVGMDEMQPPHEYLDPSVWGFVQQQ